MYANESSEAAAMNRGSELPFNADPVVEQLWSLCRDVTRSYVRLMGWRRRRGFALIDLHIVTDEEVARREGSAALLQSVHAPRYALQTPFGADGQEADPRPH